MSSSNEGTRSYCNVTNKLNEYWFYNEALRNHGHISCDIKKNHPQYYIILNFSETFKSAKTSLKTNTKYPNYEDSSKKVYVLRQNTHIERDKSYLVTTLFGSLPELPWHSGKELQV